MKKSILLFLLLTVTFLGKAQQDPFFSHFALNPVYYNPGWLGVDKSAYAAFHHRTQWLGYPDGGAPSTQMLTVSVPVVGKLSGLGLNLTNDNLGPNNFINFQVGASYLKKWRNGALSLGIMPAVYMISLNTSRLVFVDPEDPFNTGAVESSIQPDLSAGIYYRAYNGFYIGVASNHILEPQLNYIGNSGLESLRSYNLSGGFTKKLNRQLAISPSALVRSDLKTFTIDLGAIAYLEDKAWGGLTYRMEESLNLLVGYNFLENKVLSVGYSFDYIIQGKEAKQPTSHEFFIKYLLPDLIFGGKKPIMTPRFDFHGPSQSRQ